MQRDHRAILRAQPSRRAARLKAEGCRQAERFPRPQSARISSVPTPKKNGSPLASTQTGSRRARLRSCRARPRSATARRRFRRAEAATSPRWRAPPTTSAACASSVRAAGGRPSIPSSPRPTIASQAFRWLMEPSPEARSPASSSAERRKRARWRAASRATRKSTRSCRSPDATAESRRRRRSRSASAASAAPRDSRPGCAWSGIDAVVDATHPFAARMSRQRCLSLPVDRDAARRLHPPAMGSACTATAGTRSRPWRRRSRRSGSTRKTVFLTQGGSSSQPSPARRSIATSCARSIRRRKPQRSPDCRLILARGPFALEDETRADAAREDRGARHQEQRRQARPIRRSRRRAGSGSRWSSCGGREPPEAETLHDIDSVMAWIASHRGAP